MPLKLRLYRLSTVRYFTRQPLDPKHIFTNPETNSLRCPPKFFQEETPNLGNNYEAGKHEGNRDNIAEAVGNSIIEYKRRKRKARWTLFFGGVFFSVFGYAICYKVAYKGDELFLPLWPSKRARPLEKTQSTYLKLKELKSIAETKVYEKLSMHKMIKEQYGVPLRTADGKRPETQRFDAWQEDQYPGIMGLLLEPSNYEPKRSEKALWHSVPHFCKWRIGYKRLHWPDSVSDILEILGLRASDLVQVINPDRDYGDFRYETPSAKRNNHERSSYISFVGEMALGPDALIVYSGRYHVNVQIDKVDLLRKEDEKLVKYVLFKSSNN
ncbi:HGR054Cp [Eremothecium sinecaudum]|uniref:HGR054Cp n=1 Tax=Eremothecium sinecaudum TaxID=45286 RepID=A0A109V065_9SACH|nr:HGR054Cp [Eremothecium sinecaudum]AMD22393.1 HGR054Cp [Eremothecium sinecaudum]